MISKRAKKRLELLEAKLKSKLSMQVVYVNDNETREQALLRLNRAGIETPRPLFIEWI